MKLKVLVDNNTIIDMYYLGEPAVSYYIENDNDKILFDVGYSDVYLKNANKMNINIEYINKVVISHGHDDHTGGIKYLINKHKQFDLIAHPDCFNYKEDSNGLYIGSPLSKKELSNVCNLKLSKEPIEVSKNIIYLGEIPVTNDFETRYNIGKTINNNLKEDDYLKDDSAIVYKNEKGLFIITGCSHSGICNIIEYAKKVCKDDRVLGIIGGFHLFKNDDRLKQTINYLKKNNIKYLYPCHCISLEAKIELAKELKINEVGVGLEIEI